MKHCVSKFDLNNNTLENPSMKVMNASWLRVFFDLMSLVTLSCRSVLLQGRGLGSIESSGVDIAGHHRASKQSP